jgi:hypothetical protein
MHYNEGAVDESLARKDDARSSEECGREARQWQIETRTGSRATTA